MKIAVFHNVPPGGAKRAVYEEVKYLAKKHDLYYYGLKKADESFLDIKKFCKALFTYDFKPDSAFNGFFARLDKDFRNFVILNKVHKLMANDIDRRGYNVCLIHPDKFTQASYLLKYLKTPTLYFCEEYLRMVYEKQFEFSENVGFHKKIYENLTRKIRKKIDKNNAKSANLIVANSKFTKKNIEEAYGVHAEYCHLGVDTNNFKPLVKSKKSNYILFVGDMDDKKGYKFAKNILNMVKTKRKIKLVSLGFSKGSQCIESDTLMSREYSSAIATVCTHENEPFGLPPLESMACETPVLAVNEGGYKETVVDGKTGYLLPRDEKVFAEKIDHLLKYPDVSAEVGREGRKHVINNFSWNKHGKIIERYLLSLAQ